MNRDLTQAHVRMMCGQQDAVFVVTIRGKRIVKTARCGLPLQGRFSPAYATTEDATRFLRSVLDGQCVVVVAEGRIWDVGRIEPLHCASLSMISLTN